VRKSVLCVCVRGEATLQHNKKIPESRIPGKAYLPFPSLALSLSLSLSLRSVCVHEKGKLVSLSLEGTYRATAGKGNKSLGRRKEWRTFFFYYFCILLGA